MASPRRERRFDATWRLTPGVIAAILGAASAAAGGGAPDGHIIYVPLPARVAEGDPLGAHGAASAPLEALIAEHARIGGGDKAHRSGDVVVILTQPDGEPILPDLAAARHAAAADTTNELAFTFDSPLFPWSACRWSKRSTVCSPRKSRAPLISPLGTIPRWTDTRSEVPMCRRERKRGAAEGRKAKESFCESSRPYRRASSQPGRWEAENVPGSSPGPPFPRAAMG